MAKAIKGDGRARAEVMGQVDGMRASMRALSLLMHDLQVRNNLDADAAEALLNLFGEIDKLMAQTRPGVEERYSQLQRQLSTLPNNLFGQRRRVRDGEVVLVDANENAARVEEAKLKYDYAAMSPKERGSFVERGANPHRDFAKWDQAKQRQYLIGSFDP